MQSSVKRAVSTTASSVRVVLHVRPATQKRSIHLSAAKLAKLTQAQAAGATTAPLLDDTYDSLLQAQIAKYPLKSLYRSPNEGDLRWNFEKTHQHTEAKAGGLVQMFNKAKAYYATVMALRSENVIAQLAAPRANKVFVPIAPLHMNRLAEDLAAVNPHGLLFAPRVGNSTVVDEIYDVIPFLKTQFEVTPDIVYDKRFPNLRVVIHTAKKNLQGMIMHRNIMAYYPATDPLVGVKHTNKEVSSCLLTEERNLLGLTEYSLINTGNLVGAEIDLNEEDIVLTTIQLHKAAGQALGAAMVLAHRAQLVIATDVFDAEKVASVLKAENSTTLVAHASEWEALANSEFVKANGFPATLKKGVIVTDLTNTATDAQVQNITKSFGLTKVTVTFGVDEASGVIFVNGQVLPHVQVKLQEGGKVVGLNTPGTLSVKGFNVFAGYQNNAKATEQVLDKEGWLKTQLTFKAQADGRFERL